MGTINIYKVSPQEEIMWLGRKIGFDIFASGATEITVRPGAIHINNGFDNLGLTKSSFDVIPTNTATFTASRWHYLTVSVSGGTYTINVRLATGAGEVRPSDSYYGYVSGDNTKYKHYKQGYYYSEAERILGCVYVDSGKNLVYIINNFDGTNEDGSNAYGYWNRFGNRQYCYIIGTSTATANTSMGYTYYGTGQLWTFPVPFVYYPYVSVQNEATANVCWGEISSLTYTNVYIYPISGSNGGTMYMRAWAEGHWHE